MESSIRSCLELQRGQEIKREKGKIKYIIEDKDMYLRKTIHITMEHLKGYYSVIVNARMPEKRGRNNFRNVKYIKGK